MSRSMRLTLIVGLAALLALALAGLLAKRNPSDAPPGGKQVPREDAATSASLPIQNGPAQPAIQATIAPTPTLASTASPAPAPMSADASTTASITRGFAGRVTDPAGKPVAGVKILWGWSDALDAAKEKTVTDAHGYYILEVAERDANAIRFSPGDNPRDFSALPLGGYDGVGRVLAALPDPPYGPAAVQRIAPGEDGRPREVNFRLEAGGWLGVTVVDEKQQPLADIVVTLHTAEQDNWTIPDREPGPRKTDSQGKIRFEALPMPAVSVMTKGYGYGMEYLPSAPLNREVTLTMKEGGVIAGRAVDAATDAPVPAFRLFVQGAGAALERARTGEVVSDTEGRFTLTELRASATYTVRAAADGYLDATLENVPAQRKADAKEIVVKLSKGAPLRIETIDAATQAPVAGQDVYLVQFLYGNSGKLPKYIGPAWAGLTGLGNQEYGRLQHEQTDAAGKATFIDDGLPSVIMIQGGGYARKAVEADARAQYKIGENAYRIPLSKGITVRGRFTDLDGKPGANRTLMLGMGTEGGGGENFSAQTDAAGDYVFQGLKPGEAGIVNQGYGDLYWSGVMFTKSIVVTEEPEQTIDFGDKLGSFTLSGKVTDGKTPLAGAWLFLENKSGWEYREFRTHTDDRGNYAIPRLIAGQYNLRVHWSDSKNHRTDNREASVDLTIGGDATRDFNLASGQKVFGRLVFPPGMSEEKRARYDSVRLVNAGTVPVRIASGDMVYDGELTGVTDGRFEYISDQDRPFRGEYQLVVSCRSTASQLDILIPKEFTVDASEEDQDLGDIEVPPQGGAKFTLTFAREEDRALFNTLDIQSTKSTDAYKYKEDGTTRFVRVALSAGPNFIVDGRFEGDYYFELTRWDGDEAAPTVIIPNRVHSDDPERESDWGEIIVYPIYRVKARLVFTDPERRLSFATARLMTTSRLQPDRGEQINGVTKISPSMIDTEGRVSFPGLFMGPYRIGLDAGKGLNAAEKLVLPTVYELANVDGDKDLGDIIIGDTGYVRVKVTMNEPGMAGQASISAFAVQVAPGTNPAPDLYRLNSMPQEQKLGPLDAGPQHLRFEAGNFTITPTEADVTVSTDPDKAPLVELKLAQTGSIAGMATFKKPPQGEEYAKLVAGTKLIVSGPGGRQTIQARETTREEIPHFYEGGVTAALMFRQNLLFMVKDLAPGNYTVRVEAPGYIAAEEQTTSENTVGYRLKLELRRLEPTPEPTPSATPAPGPVE